MPYVRCAGCGVLNYTPRSLVGRPCLECGATLATVASGILQRADPGRRLDALVRLARDMLAADVAVLTEIRDGREIARRVAGEWSPGVSLQDLSLPLQETFCQRLLDGRIGNYIRDTEADENVKDLAMARALGVRAWLGVPIRPSAAELYVLCCLSREAQPSLGDDDVRLLRRLAESAHPHLQGL